MTATLELKRLSVYRGAAIVFDETFHSGVNIIHGDNGSGKSTIADFIYFALGGELREWRKEAALAEYVVAEVKAGGATLTLRREVSADAMRPMYIYFGEYSDGLDAGVQAWERFPYKRPEGTGYSFSQVLFRAIGIPEAVSDGMSNLTMNQILRVIYADQLTPVQRIFRVEPFDTWQTRQAVGDVLCGVGGYDLYALQIFLRDVDKAFNEVASRLRGLIQVASSYGDRVLSEHIDQALAEADARREQLNQQLISILDAPDTAGATSDASATIARQRREFASAKAEVGTLNDKLETLEYEERDSDLFVEHLRASIEDFDDSAATFYALGAVKFEFCPSCFRPLDDAEHGAAKCHLCGGPEVVEPDASRTLAVRLDLEMQLTESIKLQEVRRQRAGELRAALRTATGRLRSATTAYDLSRRGAATKYEILVAEVSRQLGRLDAEIQALQQRRALAAEIEQLSEEKVALNQRLQEIKGKIEATEASQRRRKSIAYTLVSEETKRILGMDLSEHNDFGQVDHVSFDFGGDWLAINGDKNRVGSASGMVILKNSFLLGLFFASTADSRFGLPRFMLFDNIEDKGMVQERSWRFQNTIMENSAACREGHQIIFTTSKIAPNLEGSSAVVGRKFTAGRKTLNIV